MSDVTALYRFYSVDGVLLYVGITHRIPERFSSHKRNKPWEEISTITVEHYPTREQALAAEQHAIKTEAPVWNITHNTGARAEVRMTQMDSGGLVGQFFHSFKEAAEGCGCRLIDWQGQVIAKIDDSHYYVETFEWLMGEPHARHVVRIESMVGWYFYDTDEWMRWQYDEGGLHRRSERHYEQHEKKVPA